MFLCLLVLHLTFNITFAMVYSFNHSAFIELEMRAEQ